MSLFVPGTRDGGFGSGAKPGTECLGAQRSRVGFARAVRKSTGNGPSPPAMVLRWVQFAQNTGNGKGGSEGMLRGRIWATREATRPRLLSYRAEDRVGVRGPGVAGRIGESWGDFRDSFGRTAINVSPWQKRLILRPRQINRQDTFVHDANTFVVIRSEFGINRHGPSDRGRPRRVWVP